MPQPPKKGETKKEFIGRCVPYLIKEGKTPDQAKGQCYGMWQSSKKTKKNWYDNINKESDLGS